MKRTLFNSKVDPKETQQLIESIVKKRREDIRGEYQATVQQKEKTISELKNKDASARINLTADNIKQEISKNVLRLHNQLLE